MAQDASFTLFDTALGVCGLAWGENGLVGVWLPMASAEALRSKIQQKYPDAGEAEPGGEVADAVVRIGQLLATGEADLSPIRLDLARLEPFEREVYAIARAVPPGRTITYGEIARKVGDVAQSRRVGQAMGANRWPIVIPCHRVLGADGKAGGFSAPGGLDTKLKLLVIEKARVGDAPGLFDDLPLAVKPRG
jgi:methylated-DNA-[protein]-cysteine S-methyltransferase